MRVLFVSSEVYPLAKTGGLADFSEALPRALTRSGVDVRVLMPAYAVAKQHVTNARPIADLSGIIGIDDAQLLSTRLPDIDLPIWLVDAPCLYDRDGLYQDASGQNWPDNARRFAFLSHVAARLAMGQTEVGWRPDIVHANDWHAGLVPLLLSQHGTRRPASVFTIHNLAFQGLFPREISGELGLTDPPFAAGEIEHCGRVSFLKAGILSADCLTTVSHTYAREILTAEFGFGLEAALRARADALTGILNGADYDIWDPAHDPFLAHNYGPGNLNGKKRCKVALQRELGLPEAPETPVLAFVSRLTEQKMGDVLAASMPRLAEADLQLLVLGDGEHSLVQELCDIAAMHPDKMAVRIGYEEPLAHRMQAGADILLAPARFEPCGLCQIYAMRYGTIPIVRATGGLVDTVVDTNRSSISDGRATGFVFTAPTAEALEQTVARACAFYREPLAWRRLQLSAMRQDLSWNRSAGEYLALYGSVTGEPQAAALARFLRQPDAYDLEQAAS